MNSPRHRLFSRLLPASPSISKLAPMQIAVDEKTAENFFIPLLESKASLVFWCGVITFLSIYGVVVRFPFLTSWYEAGIQLLDFFLVNICIVFSILLTIHFTFHSHAQKPIQQQIRRFLLITVILASPATILAKVIEFILLNDMAVFDKLWLELLVNTFLAFSIFYMLLFYFSNRYQKLMITQQLEQQRLTEQNEQIKARITPHFFFNMLNTLQYLSETEPTKSVALIEHISKLYRASFSDIKEIALTDEIELCKHYLEIEHYRFGSKLVVTWDLPDEDVVYDMVITSLTLQMVIEKIVLMIVEISMQTIYLTIKIRWENNTALIDITANLPMENLHNSEPEHEILARLDFKTQEHNLQYYFGTSATINYHIDHSTSPYQLLTQIHYPLTDVHTLI